MKKGNVRRGIKKVPYPSAEAYKEIGGGVLKDEGGSGLLGGSGKNHEQNPKQSGEGNQDEGKQEGGMTEAESEQDEEGAHEGNPDVPKSYKQAHPSHPSHTHHYHQFHILHSHSFFYSQCKCLHFLYIKNMISHIFIGLR